MWYTLARVLWNFEMQVAPRSRDWMQDQQAYLIWEKPPLFIQLKQLEPHVDHLNNAEKTKGRHQMQLGNEGRIPKAPGTLKIVQELHPRFGAEVSGVNFSKSISDEVFEHILRAIAKVKPNSIQYHSSLIMKDWYLTLRIVRCPRFP